MSVATTPTRRKSRKKGKYIETVMLSSKSVKDGLSGILNDLGRGWRRDEEEWMTRRKERGGGRSKEEKETWRRKDQQEIIIIIFLNDWLTVRFRYQIVHICIHHVRPIVTSKWIELWSPGCLDSSWSTCKYLSNDPRLFDTSFLLRHATRQKYSLNLFTPSLSLDCWVGQKQNTYCSTTLKFFYESKSF